MGFLFLLASLKKPKKNPTPLGLFPRNPCTQWNLITAQIVDTERTEKKENQASLSEIDSTAEDKNNFTMDWEKPSSCIEQAWRDNKLGMSKTMKINTVDQNWTSGPARSSEKRDNCVNRTQISTKGTAQSNDDRTMDWEKYRSYQSNPVRNNEIETSNWASHFEYLRSEFKKQIELPMWEKQKKNIYSWKNVKIANAYEKIVATWQGLYWEVKEENIIFKNLTEKMNTEQGIEKWGTQGVTVYRFDNTYEHILQEHRFAVRPPLTEAVSRNQIRPNRWYIHIYQTRVDRGNGDFRSLKSRVMAKYMQSRWPKSYWPRPKDVNSELRNERVKVKQNNAETAPKQQYYQSREHHENTTRCFNYPSFKHHQMQKGKRNKWESRHEQSRWSWKWMSRNKRGSTQRRDSRYSSTQDNRQRKSLGVEKLNSKYHYHNGDWERRKDLANGVDRFVTEFKKIGDQLSKLSFELTNIRTRNFTS